MPDDWNVDSDDRDEDESHEDPRASVSLIIVDFKCVDYLHYIDIFMVDCYVEHDIYIYIQGVKKKVISVPIVEDSTFFFSILKPSLRGLK